MRMLPIVTLLVLAAAGSVTAQDLMYSERERIMDASRLFSHSYMTRDIEALAMLYTEDAIIVPNGRDAIRGRDRIREYFTPPPERTIIHHATTVTDLRIEGDTAYDLGTYIIKGKNGDKEWGPSHGNYFIIWRRTKDGSWKMSFDMWNRRPDPAE